MLSYLRDHWDGRQPIVWSVLINGVGAYLIAVGAVVAAGDAIGSPDSRRPSFWLLFCGFFAVVIWSLVGIVRSAFRTIRNSETGIASKAISVAALFLVVVVIIVSAPDVARLLRTLAR